MGGQASTSGPIWVTTWAAALQPATEDDPTDLSGALLRQTVRVSIGGTRLRLQLSNVYGRAPARVEGLEVALPLDGHAGARAIAPGTSRAVRFVGQAGVVIAPGQVVTSDPLEFVVADRANLTVTLRLAPGRLDGVTTHPGSRTTSFVAAVGERGDGACTAVDLVGAQPVEHWYFLDAIEVEAPPSTVVIATLGDSLTDGRGTTTDGNDRWPDQVADRLGAGGTTIGIVNAATGGNRVLHDGLGIAAVTRVGHDALDRAGVRWLVIFEGVNDIGTAEATDEAQDAVLNDLINAYIAISRRAKDRGIGVLGATITPFGGNDGYDDPGGRRELTRLRLNAWIRANGMPEHFDAVLDFDAAVRDEGQPSTLSRGFDVGDGLHLNPAGNRALAQAFPTDLT